MSANPLDFKYNGDIIVFVGFLLFNYTSFCLFTFNFNYIIKNTDCVIIL